MRSPALVTAVVIGLVGLHFLLHVGFGLDAAAPDLLTVALLIGAREVDLGKGASLGLIFGLLEDALSVLSFGANTVTMTVLGFLGALTRDLFVGDSLIFLVSYLFLGKVLRDLFHWVMVGPTLRDPIEQVLLTSAVAGMYATIAGIVVLALTGLWRESST